MWEPVTLRYGKSTQFSKTTRNKKQTFTLLT